MTEQATSLLSHHAREVIDGWVAKYPPEQKQSAVLAALREVQHENQGFITTALMDAVADYLDMPRIAVYEVASFYSMFETAPCGRHHVAVCTNVSCMLRGSDDIVSHTTRRASTSVAMRRVGRKKSLNVFSFFFSYTPFHS